MRNPFLVQIFIKGVRDEDIRFTLPLQLKQGTDYYITLLRFQRIIYQFVNCSIEELDIYINDRLKDEYQLLKEHEFVFQDQIIFSQEFLQKEAPLSFLIIWKDPVHYWKEQLNIKRDYRIMKRDYRTMEQNYLRLNEQVEFQKQQYTMMEKAMFRNTKKIQNPEEEGDITPQQDRLDVAILYSNPLLYQSQGDTYIVPPIGYYDEIAQTKELLMQSGKDFRYTIKLATKQNLKLVLDMQPIVLQVICHGEYDKKQQQFFLGFENLGYMDPLFQTDLKVLFSSSQTKSIQLVLLSCCHSGEIAQIIKNSTQIPYVIAVSSEFKIQDHASQIFSKNLFHNLSLQQSVEVSHEEASRAIKSEKGQDCYTCCCAHKHVPNCPFEQRVMDNQQGLEMMHHMHSPQCNCKYKKRSLHIWDNRKFCDWGKNYIEELFGAQVMEDIEELEESKLIEMDQKYYIKICCCDIYSNFVSNKSENTIHDESLKFKIYSTIDPTLPALKPFEKKIKGESQEIHPYEIANITIVGRNSELHTLYRFIQVKKQGLFYVVGDTGSGRTELVKQAMSYAKERDHKHQHKVILKNEGLIDIQEVKFEQKLIDTFVEKLDFPQIRSSEKLMQRCKDQRGVIAIDNADNIYQHDSENFSKFLRNFKQTCPDIIIIVIINRQTYQKIQKLSDKPSDVIILNKLSENVGAQLFLSCLDNREKNPVFEKDIEDKQLFKYVQLYPKYIIEVANRQNETKSSFLQTIEYYSKIYNQKLITSEEQVRNQIQILKAIPNCGEYALKLLNVICLFPGIIKSDILQLNFMDQPDQPFQIESIQLDGVIQQLEQLNLIEGKETQQLDQISYTAKSYFESKIFQQRDDIRQMFQDVLEHQCTIIRQFLYSKSLTYQERLFDYSIFSQSSFLGLSTNDFVSNFNNSKISVQIDTQDFFLKNHRNWDNILRQLEEQFAINSKKFIIDVNKYKKSQAEDSDIENKNLQSFVSFIELICYFTEYVLNVFFLNTIKTDKVETDFIKILNFARGVLNKTISELLKKPLKDHDRFKSILKKSMDLCNFTLIKINFLAIDFTISQFHNPEESQHKIDEIKEYQDEIRKTEGLIVHDYQSPDQVSFCLTTEIDFLLEIGEVLPLILEIRTQRITSEEAISDHEKPQIVRFKNLKTLIYIKQSLDEILEKFESRNHLNYQERLLFNKICLVRFAILQKKMFQEYDLLTHFSKYREATDVVDMRSYLQIINKDCSNQNQIKITSIENCKDFCDWMSYMTNQIELVSEKPSIEQLFWSRFKKEKAQFRQQMLTNQNNQIHKIFAEMKTISFDQDRLKQLGLVVQLLQAKYYVFQRKHLMEFNDPKYDVELQILLSEAKIKLTNIEIEITDHWFERQYAGIIRDLYDERLNDSYQTSHSMGSLHSSSHSNTCKLSQYLSIVNN